MAVVRANPDGIFKPDSYSQIATASGSRTVYMSGQVSQDETGKVVGINDLAAQAEQCYRNVVIALKGAGASFADVAKITAFVERRRPSSVFRRSRLPSCSSRSRPWPYWPEARRLSIHLRP